MVFSQGEARLNPAGFADLDRFILLGPDTALVRRSRAASRLAETGSQTERWMLELYEEDDDVVRVVIAGEEG
jgi:hypothetical protein